MDYLIRIFCADLNVQRCIDNISPVTTHMGIFKNCYLSIRKNLSIVLHSFSSYASTLIYPDINKIYMITNPTPIMTKIIFDEFNKVDKLSSIWIGDKKQRYVINEYKEFMELSDQIIHPSDPDYDLDLIPFDNIDDKIWSVRNNSEVYFFYIPEWFNNSILFKNSSYTLIIKIQTLIDMFVD